MVSMTTVNDVRAMDRSRMSSSVRTTNIGRFGFTAATAARTSGTRLVTVGWVVRIANDIPLRTKSVLAIGKKITGSAG